MPACALALGGCAAPFSDLQGAHTVPKGTLELTPSYSSVAASGDGESGLLQREYTKEGPTAFLLVKVNGRVSQWLAEHIAQTDRRFGDYLKTRDLPG